MWSVHDSGCLVPQSDHIEAISYAKAGITGMCADEKARLETELGRARLFTALSKDSSRDLCSRVAAQHLALHSQTPISHV